MFIHMCYPRKGRLMFSSLPRSQQPSLILSGGFCVRCVSTALPRLFVTLGKEFRIVVDISCRRAALISANGRYLDLEPDRGLIRSRFIACLFVADQWNAVSTRLNLTVYHWWLCW